MNSPDNSDNTRCWRAIYIHQNCICILRPVGVHNNHFHNNHNRGLLQIIIPLVWHCDAVLRLSNLPSHHEGYRFSNYVRMSCRCDDNFTTNYASSHSSPFHNVVLDEAEDFTAATVELCHPHPSYWIQLCPVFNKLSFKNVITDFISTSSSIYIYIYI